MTGSRIAMDRDYVGRVGMTCSQLQMHLNPGAV